MALEVIRGLVLGKGVKRITLPLVSEGGFGLAPSEWESSTGEGILLLPSGVEEGVEAVLLRVLIEGGVAVLKVKHLVLGRYDYNQNQVEVFGLPLIYVLCYNCAFGTGMRGN